MGGKRPDQYQIAPDEAGATDYKHHPQEPSDLNAERDKPAPNETPWSGQHAPAQEEGAAAGKKPPSGYKRRTRAVGRKPQADSADHESER